MSATQLFTIGYSGFTPDEFLSLLEEHEIDSLVDVRQRAGSRKRGFGKSALIEATAQRNIGYTHFGMLGTPAELRKRLKAGQIELPEYLGLYRAYAEGERQSLAELLDLVMSKRCCLLCVEPLPEECHRTVLAKLLAQLRPKSIQITHLVRK